jgi:hypothetical protein
MSASKTRNNMKRAFENWLWEDLEIEFGLSQKQIPEFDNWLNNQETITDRERENINILSNIFNKHYKNWNEDELKMQFIAPLLLLVNYYSDNFTPFSQRNISATIHNWELQGRVDWMLAHGKQTPRKPHFFLHEYKREIQQDGDPQGQLLAEMLVAQHLNQDNLPIYGAYVVGKDWNFMLLKESYYAVSRPYQANEDHDLDTIFKTLKEVKNILPKI